MPPHSKKNKSSSKRVTLTQKKKVLKKIKKHQIKKVKQARNLACNPKRKVEKESGIENDRPFDEEELKALEARRAHAVEALELRKTAQKERGQKRKLSSFEDDDSSNLADDAFAVKDSDDSNMGGLNRESGDRAFYKELVKVIELSDVILEVLDARDPLGTRCGDMEKMVRKAGPNKHLVLLLNKIDLVPRESVESWLKYLREESPTVAFKCSTQEQRSNLGWKSSSKASKSSNTLQTSDCLGAETLLKLLKNYSRSHEIKKSITVGVIGLPNVGKSSLINSLKRCRVVNVGATPGLTRSMQEVHLDKDVKLLDCPGVVMLKSGENDASVALRNCKRIEKLADPVGPVNEVLKLCPAQMLINLYKIPSFETVDDFLQKVAIARGKLKKGGLVDVQAAARIVLHDWNEGKIPYYTMPPTRNEGAPMEARIVSELGKEFNVDEVYNSETSFIGSLKTIEDLHTVDADVAPVCPILFDSVTVEDDVRTQASDGDEMAHDGDDQSMVNEGDNASKSKQKTIAIKQNEKLYTAEGILNPNLKRAEKKRRKKANKSTFVDIMDGDYDTNVDLKAESSMDDAEEDNSNDDGVLGISAEIPMSGVEFED